MVYQNQNLLPNRPPIWLFLIRESFLNSTARGLQVLLGPVHARSGTVYRTAASNDPENHYESCFEISRAFPRNGLLSGLSTLQGNPQARPAGAHRDGNGRDHTAALAALHSEEAREPVTYCLTWPKSGLKAHWRGQYRVDRWSQSFTVPECSAESTPLLTSSHLKSPYIEIEEQHFVKA